MIKWKDFILAGRAVFTIDIPSSFIAAQKDGITCKPHYTYRVKKSKPTAQYRESWFVELLTGPDNTNSYTYVGMLNVETGELRLTKKSKYHEDIPPVRLLTRILARVWSDEVDEISKAGFTLHHAGKCCRCGRLLSTPESCKIGIGPECRKHFE